MFFACLEKIDRYRLEGDVALARISPSSWGSHSRAPCSTRWTSPS